jgi:hypothetical protein
VIEAVGSSVNVLGLALLPILLASFQRWQLRPSVVAAVTLATLLALGRLVGAAYDPPLAEHQIWALGELGTAESLVAAYSPSGTGRWTWILVPVVLMAGGQWIAAVLRWWRPGAAEVLLGSLLVGQFGLIALLWLFYDRYVLTLFVPALALVLVKQPVRRPAVAVVALAALASLSALGMRDHLAYNHALWQAVRELQRRGAHVVEINAGYVVNGWLQYAHPGDAPKGPDGTPRIPWINGAKDDPLRYWVANGAAPGYVTLQTFQYRRWLGRSGQIFLLERQEHGRAVEGGGTVAPSPR